MPGLELDIIPGSVWGTDMQYQELNPGLPQVEQAATPLS